MDLKVEKGDTQLVQDLIEVHATLNEGGRHWHPKTWRATEKRGGEKVKCKCLVSGINSVANEGTTRHSDMAEALFAQLPYQYRYGAKSLNTMNRRDRVKSKVSRLVTFNDTRLKYKYGSKSYVSWLPEWGTKEFDRAWKQVEGLILRTVTRERKKT